MTTAKKAGKEYLAEHTAEQNQGSFKWERMWLGNHSPLPCDSPQEAEMIDAERVLVASWLPESRFWFNTPFGFCDVLNPTFGLSFWPIQMISNGFPN